MTNSENTFATKKEMTMRYPNQSLARHFNLHKQRMPVYGLSLHLGSSESSKIVEQKLIHLIIAFFVTVFPPIA